jgi:hypothetical protein
MVRRTGAGGLKLKLGGALFDPHIFFQITEEAKVLAIEELRAVTPVDTGLAEKSWTPTITGVKNETDYLSYVNDGTYRITPRLFVEKTIPVIEAKIIGHLVKRLSQ